MLLFFAVSFFLFGAEDFIMATSKCPLQDNVVSFLSSIFIRRLLHPGVHHTEALRATLLDYNRRWTDSEFEALTVDEVKKELLFLIEHEVTFSLNFCSYSQL